MPADLRPFCTSLGKAVLLGLLCVALQNLQVSYIPTIAGPALPARNPSLVHPQWGLILAIAMLARQPIYLRTVFVVVFAGWLVRVFLRNPDFGWNEVPPYLVGHGLIYAGTVGCVRLLGWPRTPANARVRVRDLLPFALVALVLFPLLHVLVFWATQSFVVGPQRVNADVMGNVLLARHFGVLVVTMPLVALWTGFRNPAPLPYRIPWWEWLLPLLLVSLMAAFILAQPDPRQRGLPALVDLRFMIAALLGWLMLRLPWRWSMPLLSLACWLMVAAIAAMTRQADGHPLLQLMHAALEVSALQMMLLHIVLMARDNRDALQRMALDSRTDGLSGVPNINALRHDLGLRQPCPPEIGFVAIDRMDELTATLGLPAQEAMTAALHAYLQPGMRAYTLGIGRFALLPASVSADWTATLRHLENFEFRYADAALHVEPYLGIGVLASGADLEQALHAAHQAMQTARLHGEVVPVHAAASDGPADNGRRQSLQTHSLALSLLRQRKVALHVQTLRRIDGLDLPDMGEVLCRLHAPDGRVLMPGEFLPDLKSSRGIVELDRAVVETLIEWIQRHPDLAGFQRLSVNLTGRSLASRDFRHWLLRQIDEHPGIAPRLCFELTENAIVGGFDQAKPLFAELGERGCRIALDDFGTGMQSFERLQRLRIDLLKIDGSFIRNILVNRRDHELVQAMLAIASAYQIETVAEYVENADILAHLRGMGIHWGQGYHFDRPHPLPW